MEIRVKGTTLALGLAGLALVASAAALLVLGGGDGALGRDEIAAGPSRRPAARPAPRGDLVAPAAVEAPRSVASMEPPAAAEREAARGESDSSPLDVLVVHAETGAPVAGASVELDEGAEAAAAEKRSIAAATSDEGGRARVEWNGDGGTLVARTAALRGEREVAPGETGPIRIEVAPEPHVVVRVLDHAGEPAVDVEVELVLAGPSTAKRNARTDESGLATFAELGHWLAGRSGELSAKVEALVPDEIRTTIPREPLPEGPVELVLPPLGEVELVGVLDAPGSFPSPIYLRIDEGGPVSLHELFGGSRVLNHGPTDGRVLFERVGLDLRLAASDLQSLLSGEGDPQVFAGPTRPGERRIVEMRSPAQLALEVVGRVLLPGGEPLREARLDTSVAVEASGWRRSWNSSTSTDAEGRIEVRVEGAASVEELRLELRHEDAPEPLRWEARIPVPVREPRLDLGNLRLAPMRLVAAGRVVDGTGRPVAGSEVEAELAADAPTFPIQVKSGDDGSFVLRGDEGGGPVTLRATRDGFAAAERVEVVVGASKVVLRLRDEARVTGCVLADERVPLRDLRVVCSEKRDAEPRARGEELVAAVAAAVGHVVGGAPAGREAKLGRDGCFAVGGLLPGRHDVVLALPGGETVPLARGLDLPPGETDLGSIDLRGELRVFGLRFVDETGAPVRGVQLTTSPSGEAGEEQRQRVEGSETLVVTTARSLDVVAAALEHRTARATGVDRDRELVLVAAIPVRVVIAGGLPPLPEGASLSVRLWTDDSTSFPFYFDRGVAAFDANGVAEAKALDHGEQKVAVVVRRGHGAMIMTTSLPPARGATLRIEEGATSATHEIEIDPGALAKTLDGG